MGSDAEIIIQWDDDEQISILVNGQTVSVVNYDEHGSDGMKAAAETAVAVARELGVTIIREIGEPNLHLDI